MRVRDTPGLTVAGRGACVGHGLLGQRSCVWGVHTLGCVRAAVDRSGGYAAQYIVSNRRAYVQTWCDSFVVVPGCTRCLAFHNKQALER